MCGRMSLLAPASVILDLFGVTEAPMPERRFNTAPTDAVLTINQRDGERKAELMRWGLIPSWAKDMKIGARMINARAETAASKPAFRSAFKRRRCLVVTDGFYEWQREGKQKLPWRIGMDDWRPMALAGLWEPWKKPDGEWLTSCTVLTTRSNGLLGSIHDRMPVILPGESWAEWLDADNQDAASLAHLMQPFPASRMSMIRVSTHVNNSRNDDALCAAPLDGEEAETRSGDWRPPSG